MNYESMSDFEINYLVAKIDTDGEVISMDDMWPTDNENAVQVIYKVGVSGEYKDYCNNPADMWPIIFENRIEICWFSGDKWRAIIDNQCQPGEYKKFVCVDKNPLRAAAIVFLMMQEV